LAGDDVRCVIGMQIDQVLLRAQAGHQGHDRAGALQAKLRAGEVVADDDETCAEARAAIAEWRRTEIGAVAADRLDLRLGARAGRADGPVAERAHRTIVVAAAQLLALAALAD